MCAQRSSGCRSPQIWMPRSDPHKRACGGLPSRRPRFYRQQQLQELKRLAAEDPRPIIEVYDELASNAFYQHKYC
ncbi:hypothetical protein T4B_7248 [Trichinella pseudospiralis]|nr:hypothetical protein T4A_3919 [Trichinella pseudospiralis]KRZ26093.1 hypothetical protein T4B_7248 [Trichinella pseudospiralis]